MCVFNGTMKARANALKWALGEASRWLDSGRAGEAAKLMQFALSQCEEDEILERREAAAKLGISHARPTAQELIFGVGPNGNIDLMEIRRV